MNTNTGEQMHSKWGCAVPWNNIVGLEAAATNRGQTQALESFRNEMVDAQHRAEEFRAQQLQLALQRREVPVDYALPDSTD